MFDFGGGRGTLLIFRHKVLPTRRWPYDSHAYIAIHCAIRSVVVARLRFLLCVSFRRRCLEKDLGTAVELFSASPGFIHVIERDGGNVTMYGDCGLPVKELVERQLLVNRSNMFDPDTGIQGPDMWAPRTSSQCPSPLREICVISAC